MAAVGGLGRVLRVDVEVLQHDGLAEGGLVVDPGAALAVAARADLEVEGAVDLVLLRAEDGGQVLRHPQAELTLSLRTFSKNHFSRNENETICRTQQRTTDSRS